MILFFSGTGNSAYAAKRIGQTLGEEAVDLFGKIRSRDFSPLHSDSPWVIVTPTYAWRIPRVVQDWMEHTPFSGSQTAYFIMTCGGNVGSAGEYLQKLCAAKNLQYCGCAAVVMPENYIALFPTPARDEALATIHLAESVIDQAALCIRRGDPLPQTSVTLRDRISSGIVNDLFYPLFVHAKKFYATDACLSCGKCATLCPLGNIRLTDGKPHWGRACTHCMACICRCPVEAIEYGTNSKGRPRYVFPSAF